MNQQLLHVFQNYLMNVTLGYSVNSGWLITYATLPMLETQAFVKDFLAKRRVETSLTVTRDDYC
jgi:hypothetical protein